MGELITLGETMVALTAQANRPLAYGGALEMRIAGAESNTAIGMCKLGHTASFISRLGDDSFGQYVLRMLRAEGVDTSAIRLDPEHPTGLMVKEALPGTRTAVHYYRTGSAASHMTPDDLPEERIRRGAILHLTGITPVLSESCRRTVFAAAEIAASAEVPISFDPNIRKKLWKNADHAPMIRDLAARSHYLLIGLEEAEVLYGSREISRIASRVFSASSVRILAVKNGAQGAWLCDGSRTLSLPPADCFPVDPTGAGDAFNAGLLAGILDGESLENCGAQAAIAGAKATETSGDIESLITKRELHNLRGNISTVER